MTGMTATRRGKPLGNDLVCENNLLLLCDVLCGGQDFY